MTGCVKKKETHPPPKAPLPTAADGVDGERFSPSASTHGTLRTEGTATCERRRKVSTCHARRQRRSAMP